MKNLYIFLLLLIGVTSFAQKIDGIKNDIKLSPNGVLENVFDQYGNKYSLLDIKAGEDKIIKNTLSKSSVLCNSGIFDLYFETGSGMDSTTDANEIQRRTVVCQVFNDLSNFIISPLQSPTNTTRVKIWVRNIANVSNVPSNALGLATAFYNFPQNPATGFGGIVDNEVWKTIISGKDSYTNVASPLVSTNSTPNPSGIFYHGMMAFNFTGITWNTNLATDSPIGQYDLYSVVLHEVTHALGFASLIDGNGQSIFGTGFNYFSRYDKFLKNNEETQPLITNGTACSSMYNYKFNTPSLTTSILHPNPLSCVSNQTTCATAVKFVGTSTVPVYTPNCFEQGSSLSHFEDLCVTPNVNDNYFTMSNAISNGTPLNSVNTKRFLKFQERNTLADIGYKLNTTYGNNTMAYGSFNDYGGVTTAGVNVAGINDGINPDGTYLYTGDVATFITINSTTDTTRRILANDTNAVSFECLQDVYASSIISSPFGTLNTNITFYSTTGGLHLLRYVPIDAAGKRGNITYVYIYLNQSNNCATPTNNCNLVLNGNFEQYSELPSGFGGDGFNNINKACNWSQTNQASPDYFHANAISPNGNFVGVPCNAFGYETDNNGGNAYAGMIITNYYGSIYSESIKTKLATALQPNTSYELSFDVSLSEGNERAAKLQAFLTQTELPQLANNLGELNIPPNEMNMLFTNPTFSTIKEGWEHITFIIPARSNAGEQYLYLGGIKNIEITNVNQGPQIYCGTQTVYNTIGTYFIDNVSLTPNAQIPTFTQVAPICAGGALNALPTTSTNTIGITGTWSPALNNMVTTTYTFTPTSGQCVSPTTMTIVVNPLIITEFDDYGSICNGGISPPLPTTSNNGITGSWAPALDNTVTQPYTFTPTSGQCATSYIMNIIVNPNVIPEFPPVGPICSGGVLNPLPTTSNNGIIGTWSPALNNMVTTTYTFIPTGSQCAITTTMTIVVLPTNNPACTNCVSNLTMSSPEVASPITHQVQDWIVTDNTYTASSGQNVTLTAGKFIHLKPNSHIKAGSVFLAKIQSCATAKIAIEEPEYIHNQNNEVMVYPNPTNELVTISAQNAMIRSILITSMEGKTVYASKIINAKSHQLNISNYKVGMYMLVIETADGKITYQKLIKN